MTIRREGMAIGSILLLTYQITEHVPHSYKCIDTRTDINTPRFNLPVLRYKHCNVYKIMTVWSQVMN